MKKTSLFRIFLHRVYKKEILKIITAMLFLVMIVNINQARAVSEELQQRKVTGMVTDSKTGDPLPGVNIVLQGSTVGTMSNAGGQFSIDVPGANAVLVFSFIGYVAKDSCSRKPGSN